MFKVKVWEHIFCFEPNFPCSLIKKLLAKQTKKEPINKTKKTLISLVLPTAPLNGSQEI